MKKVTIKPKFHVKQVLQHRFNNHTEGANKRLLFLVREIQTLTCYSGTQIYYICLPLIGEKNKFTDEFEEMPGDSNKMQKFPENELEEVEIKL